MANGSGLPVLEVPQAERDNCILAVSFLNAFTTWMVSTM